MSRERFVVGRMMELSVLPSVTEIVIISLIVVVRAVVRYQTPPYSSRFKIKRNISEFK